MSVLYPKCAHQPTLVVIHPDSQFRNFVTFDVEGQKNWVEVLNLANTWESHTVRQLAISRLQNLHTSDPISLLVLARRHQVQQWIRQALTALCKRTCLPDRDELRVLDKEDLLLLFTLRATCGDDEDQIKTELDAYFDAEAIKAEIADAHAFAEAARIQALADEVVHQRALAEKVARERAVAEDESRAQLLAEEEERLQRQREELEAELARRAVEEGFEPMLPMVESPLSAVLAPGEHPDFNILPPVVEERPLTPAPLVIVTVFTDYTTCALAHAT